jgi:hypothetical protein
MLFEDRRKRSLSSRMVTLIRLGTAPFVRRYVIKPIFRGQALASRPTWLISFGPFALIAPCPVCAENLIRVDDVTESPELVE